MTCQFRFDRPHVLRRSPAFTIRGATNSEHPRSSGTGWLLVAYPMRPRADELDPESARDENSSDLQTVPMASETMRDDEEKLRDAVRASRAQEPRGNNIYGIARVVVAGRTV